MPKRKTHALRCSILVPHAGRRFTRAYGDGCTKGAASTERRTRLKSFDRPNYGRSFLWALRNWGRCTGVVISDRHAAQARQTARPPSKNRRSAQAGLSPWGRGQERKPRAREKLATLPWGGETPPRESSAHAKKNCGDIFRSVRKPDGCLPSRGTSEKRTHLLYEFRRTSAPWIFARKADKARHCVDLKSRYFGCDLKSHPARSLRFCIEVKAFCLMCAKKPNKEKAPAFLQAHIAAAPCQKPSSS